MIKPPPHRVRAAPPTIRHHHTLPIPLAISMGRKLGELGHDTEGMKMVRRPTGRGGASRSGKIMAVVRDNLTTQGAERGSAQQPPSTLRGGGIQAGIGPSANLILQFIRAKGRQGLQVGSGRLDAHSHPVVRSSLRSRSLARRPGATPALRALCRSLMATSPSIGNS